MNILQTLRREPEPGSVEEAERALAAAVAAYKQADRSATAAFAVRESLAANWRSSSLDQFQTAQANVVATIEAVNAAALVLKEARGRRDQLVGDMDRAARGWHLPAPVSLPAMPDERLTAEERLEALALLLASLERTGKRVTARWYEAAARCDALSSFDRGIDAAVQRARYEDATAERLTAGRDRDAVARLLAEVRGELRALEAAS